MWRLLPILCRMNSRHYFHTWFIYGTEVVIFSMPEVTALFPSPWSSGAIIWMSNKYSNNFSWYIITLKHITISKICKITYIIFPPSSRRKILLRHKVAVSVPALFLWFFLFPKFQTRKRIKWSLRQMPKNLHKFN